MRTTYLILLSFYFCISASSQNVLQGGIETTEQQSEPTQMFMRLRPRSNPSELAAIGVSWHIDNGIIFYIDRSSDLVDKLQPGDRVLAINGIPMMTARRAGINFGPAGTVLTLTVQTQDGISDMQCIRRPISYFSPAFRRILGR